MENQPTYRSSVMTYVLGFALSLVLTVLAYAIIVNNLLLGPIAIAAILVLAITQFYVQVTLFLHVGQENKPRWNLSAFLFMLLVVFIVVGGSIWIMNNLNYNMMMSPEQMDDYMRIQNNKGF